MSYWPTRCNILHMVNTYFQMHTYIAISCHIDFLSYNFSSHYFIRLGLFHHDITQMFGGCAMAPQACTACMWQRCMCVCVHVCVRVPHKIKHAPEAWRSWDSWDSNLAYMELIHLTHTKRGSYDTNVLRSGSLHGFCVLTALTTVLLRSETRSQLSEQMEQEMQTTMTPTMQTTQECWRKRNHGRTQILVNPLQST